MKLFTQEIKQELIRNGQQQDEVKGTEQEIDFLPVVKLFTPDANCTWLLTEIEPEYPDIAFGLCDLGMQCPELGSVSIAELTALRGGLGLPIERDQHFKAEHPLSVFTEAARTAGAITTNVSALAQAVKDLEAEGEQ